MPSPQKSASCTDEGESSPEWDKKWLLAATTFILALWLIAPVLARAISSVYAIANTESLGQIGDLYGAVNALFSGLAFLVIAITLVLQNRELLLQRKDSHDARSIASKQTEQMQLQVDSTRATIYIQACEPLLSKATDVVFSVNVDAGKVPGGSKTKSHLRGDVVISRVYKDIVRNFVANDAIEKGLLPVEQFLSDSLTRIVNDATPSFDHWIRRISIVLSIIDIQVRRDLGEVYVLQFSRLLSSYFRPEDIFILLAMCRCGLCDIETARQILRLELHELIQPCDSHERHAWKFLIDSFREQVG